MQITATMKYHLTLVRMANIRKTKISMCLQGCAERGTLTHWRWECELVQLLQKTIWSFLTKLEIELPYDPVITLVGIFPEELKSVC
jgi:hypothetical protein